MYKGIIPESRNSIKDNAFRLIFLYVFTFGVIAVLLISGIVNETRHQQSNNQVTIPIVKDTTKVDTSIYFKVYSFINEVGIKYPDLVFAKAVLESGHFKSKLFLNKNNLFGMKKAMRRSTLGQGNANEYAYFKSIEESIIDYKLYQMLFIDEVSSKEEYLRLIAKSYSGNKNYETLVLQVLDSLKEKYKWIKTKS
ncbi:MAG: Sphingomonas phage [Bacteroidota bacterium]|jgi:uncharacterized FlgJ-related protein